MKIHAYILCLFLYAACLKSAVTAPIVFCTFFTPSHECLAQEWMIASLQDDDVPLIIGTGEQKCPSAIYHQEGWQDTMIDKADFIIKMLKEHRGSIVVFIDPDIVFFKPIKERLIRLIKHYDFVAQRDKPTTEEVCTGFIAMHANDVMIACWQDARNLMTKNNDLDDQAAFNRALSSKKKIKWKLLPKDEFFGGGTFTGAYWTPGKRLTIPSNPRMFHANFCAFPNKITMLEYVQKVVLCGRRFL
jgi:hypothetical protein